MKWMMITCKQATLLLAKKEEGTLGWVGKIKLRGHLAICSICRRFEIQTRFISKHASEIYADATLSVERKEKIRSVLKD
jgi:hypothetical protein